MDLYQLSNLEKSQIPNSKLVREFNESQMRNQVIEATKGKSQYVSGCDKRSEFEGRCVWVRVNGLSGCVRESSLRVGE